MTQPWTETDGRLLRTLRERSGIDRANFARRNTLSVGQLIELEEGGQGRFYNDRIRAHTGHTLLDAYRLDGTRLCVRVSVCSSSTSPSSPS